MLRRVLPAVLWCGAAWALCVAIASADAPVALDGAWEREGAGGTEVHVDVRLAADPPTQEALIGAGLEIEIEFASARRVQGWIARSRVGGLAALPGVAAIRAPAYAFHAAGSVVSAGDGALGAAQARAQFGIDGSGVRIAVISDGIGGLTAAQEAGDAPQLAEARAFGSGSLERGDEGTAMIEVVHDLAPGAAISFGAVATDADMMAAVDYFAERVDVIVDDVSFFFPADQQSEVSRNTAAALAEPGWPLRAYVTAAGNWAERHWGGAFAAGPDGAARGLPPGPLHLFGGSGEAQRDAENSLWIESGGMVELGLYWQDPWGRSTNDYDLHLADRAGQIVASSAERQAAGQLNPAERLRFRNEGGGAWFSILIQNWRGLAEPSRLDLFVLSGGGDGGAVLQHATAPRSLLAQSDSAGGAITVAAMDAATSDVRSYSSRGPTQNGAVKPELAALDSVAVSAASSHAPLFGGTSAAAPHVAAAAALLLSAQPALLAGDGGDAGLERRLVRDLLLGSAEDIGNLGLDDASGAGAVDAFEAVARAAGAQIVDAAGPTLTAAINRVNRGGTPLILLSGEGSVSAPLPALTRDGAVISGAGWTIDAEGTPYGLVVEGDGVQLQGLRIINADRAGLMLLDADDAEVGGVELAGNGIGLIVDGSERVRIDGIRAVANAGAGVMFAAGSSGWLSNSLIGLGADGEPDGNGGAGVLIAEGAGDVVVGPPLPPSARRSNVPAADRAAPLGVLPIAEIEPRSGAAHVIRGSLTIDGFPAPPQTSIDVFLDRRFAGSFLVGDAGRFSAAATGPGRVIRFSIDGVPAPASVSFEAGGEGEVSLAVGSPGRLEPASAAGGNRIMHNGGAAVEILGEGGARDIWANEVLANAGGLLAPLPSSDLITTVAFDGDAATIRGSARDGAARVDLYAGRSGEPARYIGTAPASAGRFELADVIVGDADEFLAVASDAAGIAQISQPHHARPAPTIDSVSPAVGSTLADETVSICGNNLNEDMQVFFGGARAEAAGYEDGCLEVATAPAPAGIVDVAVRRADGRTAIARRAYEYRHVRSVTLQPGGNFVAWTGPNAAVALALGGIAALNPRLFAWDAGDEVWLRYSTLVPNRFNTLRELRTGQAIWLYIELDEPVEWLQPLR